MGWQLEMQHDQESVDEELGDDFDEDLCSESSWDPDEDDDKETEDS